MFYVGGGVVCGTMVFVTTYLIPGIELGTSVNGGAYTMRWGRRCYDGNYHGQAKGGLHHGVRF